MAIKRHGSLPLLSKSKIMDTLIEEKLNKIGLAGVKAAIEKHEFNNDTLNLEDSYGYAIYNNGRIIGDPFLFNKQSTKTRKYKGREYSGHEETIRLLREYQPETTVWTLVVMAGMRYASFVEDYYKLDVLQASFLVAKGIADKELKNIKFDAIK